MPGLEHIFTPDSFGQHNRISTKFSCLEKKFAIYGVHAAVGEFIWILGIKTNLCQMYGTSSSGIES